MVRTRPVIAQTVTITFNLFIAWLLVISVDETFTALCYNALPYNKLWRISMQNMLGRKYLYREEIKVKKQVKLYHQPSNPPNFFTIQIFAIAIA